MNNPRGRATTRRFLVSASDDIPKQQLNKARMTLEQFADEHFDKFFRNATSRYEFVVTEAIETGRDTRYKFLVMPKSRRRSRTSEDGTQRFFYRETDALPADPDLLAVKSRPDSAYRGMSFDEWQVSLEEGEIRSRGDYIFGTQAGMTFFGKEFFTAAGYAAGFAPFQHMPTRNKPGVIIEVPRKLLLDHEDRPGAVTNEEMAAEGGLPLDGISRAWYVVPTEAEAGIFTLIRSHDGKVDGGSFSHPWSSRVIIPMEDPYARPGRNQW